MSLDINGSGFLFSLDTRVKWVGVFVIAFVILSIPIFTWAVYILLFSILMTLSISSQMPLRQIFKRTLLIEVPLLFVLIPLPFLNRSIPNMAFSILGVTIHLSLTELLRVGVLMLRSWLIIFTMVLFTMTTSTDELLSSLSALGVPAVLVNIILLMWRYLALFIANSQKMSAARELRSVLSDSDKGKRERGKRIFRNMQSAGSILGCLFVRAYEQSERVYQAMLLRGFDGTLRSIKNEPLQPSQKFQMLFVLVLGFCFIIGAYGIYGN